MMVFKSIGNMSRYTIIYCLINNTIESVKTGRKQYLPHSRVKLLQMKSYTWIEQWIILIFFAKNSVRNNLNY